jgi:hypothetical protein
MRNDNLHGPASQTAPIIIAIRFVRAGRLRRTRGARTTGSGTLWRSKARLDAYSGGTLAKIQIILIADEQDFTLANEFLV